MDFPGLNLRFQNIHWACNYGLKLSAPGGVPENAHLCALYRAEATLLRKLLNEQLSV